MPPPLGFWILCTQPNTGIECSKLFKLGTFIMFGQHDKGLIRPLRLTAHPVLKNIFAVQRLLRYEHDLDDALQMVHHFPHCVAHHGN